jgi:hypothetical protein
MPKFIIIIIIIIELVGASIEGTEPPEVRMVPSGGKKRSVVIHA